MKNMIRLLMILCVMFLWTSTGFATSYVSNLTGTYGDASHSTAKWQELAYYANDYGVFWSVDDGATWGHEDLYVGQTVTFMIAMHKDNLGTHYLDLSKTWLDWGQDGVFDDEDVIGYFTEVVKPGVTDTVTSDTNAAPAKSDFIFYTASYAITEDYIGDLYLRSRVTCSESLTKSLEGSWNDQWTYEYYSQFEDGFAATGWYNQGEVEEWMITVNAAPVPEPATLLLLGSGLLGFAGSRRRKKK